MDPSLAFQQAVEAVPDDDSLSEEDTDILGHCDDPRQPISAKAAEHQAVTADVPADARQNQPPAASKHPMGMLPRQGRPRVWDCQVCTFSENPSHLLRCSICDSRKGSSNFDAPAGSLAMGATTQLGLGQIWSTPQQLDDAHAPGGDGGPHGDAGPAGISSDPWSSRRQWPAVCSRPATSTEPAAQLSRLEFPHTMQPAGSLDQGPGYAATGTAMRGEGHTSRGACSAADASPSIEGPQDGCWMCLRCRQQLPSGSRPEHEDLHAAQDLQASYGRSEDKWQEGVGTPGFQNAAMPDMSAQHCVREQPPNPAIEHLSKRSADSAKRGRPGEKRKRPAGHVTGQQGGIKSFLNNAA